MRRRGGGKVSISDAAPGLTARQGALALLSAVLDRGAMPDEAGLAGTPAERAEARGLADLTLRRLGQTDALLGRFVQRMPRPPVAHVLRLMAAELVFAGTAPHAAVDLAVRLAQRGRGAGFAGMVNAVGHRLAEEGAEIAAAQDAARLNAPGWLWGRLSSDWGGAATRAIATAHLAGAPVDLTPRDPAGAETLAAALGATLLPTGTLRLTHRPQISALPGFAEGAWWAQDAAAALPARLVPAPAGKRVLDLCAAPGGKTLQLAAAGAKVTALDLSEARMGRLAENLARTGLTAECITADALDWTPQRPFDAVLLDAPCSATGTIRRHPDMPWRRGGPDVKGLAELQSRLFDRAAEWVAPGGTLVFCTCSLLKAEGEDQARGLAVRHPDFAPLPLTPGEAGIPPRFLTPGGELRTRPDFWPEHGGLDGFFAARLRRA